MIRAVGAGQGAVQRELLRLSQAGIITKTRRGNAIFYQANRACPVFHELSGLMVKTTGEADDLAAALRPLAGDIKAAFAYGEYAAGTATPGSAIDIMVIGTVNHEQLARTLASLQERLGRTVNPTVYGMAEFRTKAAAGHQFIYTVMRGEKIFLVGDEQQLKGLL
ncbi:MAG TPA: ArsR family transcriptional regulator [Candidatus Edwardsbacteria bacterium]|nr:ArsR family transcriptional regulator [Candidatus Edwardsbacteria bacterium]